MHEISKEDIIKAVSWLKKQRDGVIIGDYRNTLYHLYQKIYDISPEPTQTCSLKDLLDETSVYYRNENQLLELCHVLQKLGYIEMHNLTNDIKISVLKPIDF